MSLILQLKAIPDPRGTRGRRYELWLMLFLSVFGSLCGYWGYRPLAEFAREHHQAWCDLLKLDASTTPIPSYSTFRQVFLKVDAQGWVDAFNAWAMGHAPDWLGQLSVDGKSIKCTSTGGQEAGHDFASLVSVYGQSVGVVQLALMFNHKESEIAVARRLLQHVITAPELAKTLPVCVSLDALHTQVETLRLLERSQTPYLIGLKTNQRKLYALAKRLYEQTIPTDIVTEYDATHSRQVQRTVTVYPVPDSLPQRWANAGIRQLVWIHREGRRAGQPFHEAHCYLSNRCLNAETYMTHIQAHWHIENSLHWVKDVTFQEDDPPRRGGHAPISWAVLYSFFITLARKLSYQTIPQAMRALANRLDKVFPLLT